MEIEIKEEKFWMLEKKNPVTEIKGVMVKKTPLEIVPKGQTSQKWVYDDEKTACEKIKELLKTTDVNDISLISINTSGKEWNISSVSWSTITSMLFKNST